MDDMAVDDPASQYVPLGSVFIAIAIVVWTSVAVWLCYSSPPGSDTGDADSDGQTVDSTGELPDGVISRVAHGFAELLLEGKDKASSGASCEGRALDLSKLEELLSPSKGDGKVCAKKTGKSLLGKMAGSMATKDGNGHLSPLLAGLSLGKDGDKETTGTSVCDPRTAPSPARANTDAEGRNCKRGVSVTGTGVSSVDDTGGIHGGIGSCDKTVPDLAAFREQLREKLSSSLCSSSSSSGRKGGVDDLATLVAPSRSVWTWLRENPPGREDMLKNEGRELGQSVRHSRTFSSSFCTPQDLVFVLMTSW